MVLEGTLLKIFLKFFFIVFAVCFYPNVSLSNNLETCVSGKYPTLCKKNLLTSEQLVQVENAERADNLKTCVSGKYPTLCKKNLLTSEQLVQVENAKFLFDKNKNNVLSTQSSALGATSYLNMGGGDMMKLDTGDYIMSMGGGDMMNLGTGDYIMSMGGGDMMNLGTGEYLMNMGGGDMMNLSTGGLIMSFD